jgi:hypothetical protein
VSTKSDADPYVLVAIDTAAIVAETIHEFPDDPRAVGDAWIESRRSERMVGRQALEIEFLKGALKAAPRPRSETTSVIAGPAVSPSRKDVG